MVFVNLENCRLVCIQIFFPYQSCSTIYSQGQYHPLIWKLHCHIPEDNCHSYDLSCTKIGLNKEKRLRVICTASFAFRCIALSPTRNDAKVPHGIPRRCIKLYRNVLNCIVTYPNVSKCIETYQTVSKCIKLYRSVSNCIETY